MSQIVGAKELVTTKDCKTRNDKVILEIKDLRKEILDVKDCSTDIKLSVLKLKEEILEKTDQKYAIKLIERIVFGMVTLVLVTMFGALLNLIIIQ